MASFYCSMISTGVVSGEPMLACGSFGNITVDGRLSLSSAVEVARACFTKEAQYLKADYQGFVIEKTVRPWDYRNPKIIDSKCKIGDFID